MLLSFFLFWLSIPLHAQKDNTHLSFPHRQVLQQDNELDTFREDTSWIMDKIRYAKALSDKGYWLDIDTVSFLFHQIIAKCNEIHFDLGLMYCYRNLGWTYLLKDVVDSSKFYFQKANALNEVVCDDEITNYNYMDLGRAYLHEEQYDSAVIMFTASRDFSTRRKDKARVRQALNQLSFTSFQVNDIPSVITYSHGLLEIAKSWNDSAGLLQAYESFSSAYSALNLEDSLSKVNREILRIADATTGRWLKLRAYGIASGYYRYTQQYDSMLVYAKLYKSLADTSIQSLTINWDIGSAFLFMNQTDSARQYYKEFYDKALKTGKNIPAELFLALGQCDFREGHYQSALQYYKIAESKSNHESPGWQSTINLYLSEYYDTLRQPALAFKYYKKYKMLEDSIENQKDPFGAARAFFASDAEKDRNLIQLLVKEKELQHQIAQSQKRQKNTVAIGSLLLLFMGGLGFVRYKKARELKSRQRLLDERLRISRELHDEVGSTLSGLAMFSHVAQDQLRGSNLNAASSSIGIMQKSAGEMVQKLNDIVWLIHPDYDTIGVVVERLEDFARQIATTKTMQVEIHLPENLTQKRIPLEARRNIYLTCKEAITNAVKYSLGSILRIEVMENTETIQFIVKDNGHGFDALTIRRGNGLSNMEERAQEIGGLLQMDSIPGQGTKVTFAYKIIQ